MSAPSDEELDRVLAIVPESPEPEQPELGDEQWAALRRGELDNTGAEELGLYLGRSRSARVLARFQAEPLDERLEHWARAQMPRRRRMWSMVGLGIAASIALLLIFLPRSFFREAQPQYVLEVAGGVREQRGVDQPAPLVFAPAAIVELRGRPASGVARIGRPVLYVARAGGASARVEDAEIEVGANGRFRIRAPARSLFKDQLGPHTLFVVLGEEPDALRLEVEVEAVSGAEDVPR